VVRAEGSLWAFRLNNNDELADGTTTSRKWAQPVAGLSGVVAATGSREQAELELSASAA
jgi:hypothetical protein